MTNKETRALILTALANSTIEKNSSEVMNELMEYAGQSKFTIPQHTYDELKKMADTFDWSLLDYKGAYNPQQIEKFLIAACYIVKCFYFNLIKVSKKDKEKIGEDLVELINEVVRDIDLSYFPIANHFNSYRNSDAPGNVIKFLELNNVIVKRHRAYHKKGGVGRCAKYEMLPKFFEIYDGSRGKLSFRVPNSYVNALEKKIKNIAQYPQELYMMAYQLFLKPSEMDYKHAQVRIQKQKELKNCVKSELNFDKETQRLNKEVGMELSTAMIVVRIYNADPSILMMCLNDKYAGRFYHAWTSVPSKIRERAELREELTKYISNSNLVEVDLSQSCMYFIFIEYCKYCEKQGIQPTRQLAKAVFAGKLREYICLNANGLLDMKCNGHHYYVNFDEIKTINDYKRNKDELKKFCMMGLNCRLSCDGAKIFDRALATIDSNFKEWLINERKGWWNDNSTKSTVPFKTLANEVEFILGIKAWHVLPTDDKKLSETEVSFTKSKNKSITELLIKKGCKFFLTVHDAIITTEEDVKLVYESLLEAANIRGHLFAPCAKATFFNNGFEKKNCYSRGKKTINNKFFKVDIPIKDYLTRTLPCQPLYLVKGTMDYFYFKELLSVRDKITNQVNKAS